MKQKKGLKPGFSLIELIVVISIINLIVSIAVTSVQGARQNARDARRISDITQLTTALQIYHNLHDDYPAAAPGGTGCTGNWEGGNAVNTGSTFLQALVNDGIMTRTPVETGSIRDFPGDTQCTYRYGRFDLSTECGFDFRDVAVLYAALEKPPETNDGRQPACLNGVWAEGAPGASDFLVVLVP